MWSLFVVLLIPTPTGPQVSIEAADKYDRPTYQECRAEANAYQPKQGKLLQSYCIKRNERPSEKRT